MASIDVETAALHAAAAVIRNLADGFATSPAPAVSVSSAQATGAAVNAVQTAAQTADSAMRARLHLTASAMAAGGAAFAATEHGATQAINALAPRDQ
jgi:hypothetical protein